MPKVNIYLPDELAEKARAAKLSLSPICQRAIQRELNKMKLEQDATGEIAAVAARLNATVDDQEAEEYRRGRGDGIAWARDYATADELRDVVENFEPGRGDAFDRDHSLAQFTSDKEQTRAARVRHEDSPHWRGFVAGAEEVLDAVGPLLIG